MEYTGYSDFKDTLMPLFFKAAAISACALLCSCVLVVNAGETSHERHDDYDRSSVNRAITLPPGSQVEDVSSVNGRIELGDTSVAESVESVNGRVEIGQRCHIEDIETVNGDVNIGAGSVIGDQIETVNGDITLLRDVRVGGDISTVNGALKASAASIRGKVETVNGGIELLAGSRVEQGLHVASAGHATNKRKRVIVVLGEDVVVTGASVFERPVEIRKHASASLADYRGEDVRIVPFN